jgi:hypothetical protein
MLGAIAALTFAAAAHAAPAVPSFEQSLNQIHSSVLAAAANLITQEQLKKADKNVQLTANQAWQGRNNITTLRSNARDNPRDPMLGNQLYQVQNDLDVWAQNCEVVRKQVVALAQSAVKDPSLAALAKKLYEHSRVLDSNAGYLIIEARNANMDLSMAGYGGQAYRLQRLAEAGGALTPDTRAAAKTVLDKTQ